jgi:hypothetical protein
VTRLDVGFPTEDFEAMCQMLRAESTCYLHWSSDDPPGPNTTLTWCSLWSARVPPGGRP